MLRLREAAVFQSSCDIAMTGARSPPNANRNCCSQLAHNAHSSCRYRQQQRGGWIAALQWGQRMRLAIRVYHGSYRIKGIDQHLGQRLQ